MEDAVETSWGLNLFYGADYQRRMMEFRLGSGFDPSLSPVQQAILTRRFYNGNYEEDHIAPQNTKFQSSIPGDIRQIHYISAGDGLCAIMVRTDKGKGESVDSIFYVHKDYLGSLLTFSGEEGNVLYEQNFDAWGRYRNIKDGSYVRLPGRPRWLYRGYTGHEHLEQQGLDTGEFNLINMNGRLYDPINGRMLSPDNFTHDEAGTQGYNRYSYAHNNPLKFSDPDGEIPFVAVGAIIGGVLNLGFQALQGNIHSPKDALFAFGSGALAGALATMGATSLSSAVMTAVTSSISSQLPSFNIPIGNNFTLSLSPALVFGTEGLGLGLNLSGTLNVGDFSISAGIGFTGFESDKLLGRAAESRWFLGGGYDDGKDFGISYYRGSYNSGHSSQVSGIVNLRVNEFSLGIDEDFFPPPLADGEDRYRTGAFRLGYKDIFIQATIITGDPGLGYNPKTNPDGRTTTDYPGYKHGRYSHETNLHRFGGLSAGFNYNGNTYEFGNTSEKNRVGIQHWIHRNITGDPYFPMFYESFPSRNYSFFGRYNPHFLYH